MVLRLLERITDTRNGLILSLNFPTQSAFLRNLYLLSLNPIFRGVIKTGIVFPKVRHKKFTNLLVIVPLLYP